jgi:hypothetical protein
VTEFIRTHNTLADMNLVDWSDPNFHETLRGTVGQRFFHYMANLNVDYLDTLVSASRKQKIRYLDYGTECKLRRLLNKEQGGGQNGVGASEHLKRHRDFYKNWEKELFGDQVVQIPAPPPTVPQNAELEKMTVAKSSGWLVRGNMYAIVLGIIIYVAVIH